MPWGVKRGCRVWKYKYYWHITRYNLLMIWTGSFSAFRASWHSRWLHLAPGGTLASRQGRAIQPAGQPRDQQDPRWCWEESTWGEDGEMRMNCASDLIAWDTHSCYLISWLNAIYGFLAYCRLEDENIQVYSLIFFQLSLWVSATELSALTPWKAIYTLESNVCVKKSPTMSWLGSWSMARAVWLVLGWGNLHRY